MQLVVLLRTQHRSVTRCVELRERRRAHDCREHFDMKRKMQKRDHREHEQADGGGKHPDEGECRAKNPAHALRLRRQFADEDVAQARVGEQLEKHREREDEGIRAELRDPDAARDQHHRAELQQAADADAQTAGEDIFDDALRLFHRSHFHTPPAAL